MRRFLRRVRTFGFHLATLDVRQNAEVHRAIVGRALGEQDWEARGPAARTERLREALAKDESPPDTLEAAGKRALWVFEAIEYCRHRYGAQCGRLVRRQHGAGRRRHPVRAAAGALGGIRRDRRPTRCRSTSRRCSSPSNRSSAAGEIVGRLLADPIYRAHLQTPRRRQTVMIGYSDSNKAAGIVGSRWLLRKAQLAMLAACEQAGVELLVFHGRGGSVSRGGSRTEAVVGGLPTAVRSGRLRVTEQGETINDRYGLQPIALRTFEQGLNSLALAVVGRSQGDRARGLERGDGGVRAGRAPGATARSCTTTRDSSSSSRP